MTDLTRFADRLELHQLVVDYANAIDGKNWDALDRVFTPDAYIDYRAMDGIDGRYPQVKAWLAQALQPFPAYMHMTGNFACQVSGDKATGTTACLNPMVVPKLGGGDPETMLLGLWYDDEFVRTDDGWRIAKRVERRCFDMNMPLWLRAALTERRKA